MKDLLKIFGFILGVIIICSLLSSCDTMVTKNFGGEMSVNVKPGYKVTEATWKSDDSGDHLWYLVEPMDSDYAPKTKEFIEHSQYGILQGTVKFIESK